MSADIANRPGLSQLEYRIGTFGSFLADMKGRLSSAAYPELAALTTRDRSDPAIALLDAWAIVADVLTFYQERIANEGFLRTATERRSVFELARLLGYSPRPGVAAGVPLAYVLEKAARLTIRKGTRVQSVPGAVGELPQTYETSADLVARAEWNTLAPRLTMPQNIGDKTEVLYFKGANLGLKVNDPLLFVARGVDAGKQTEKPSRFVRIDAVEAYFDRGLTKVTLQPPDRPFAPNVAAFSKASLSVAASLRGDPPAASLSGATAPDLDAPAALAIAPPVDGNKPSSPSIAPAIKVSEPASLLSPSGLGDVLAALDPRVSLDDLTAVARAEAPGSAATDVYAFRVHSAPFGNNAPKRAMFGVPTRSENALNVGRTTPVRGVLDYEEWEMNAVEVSPDPAKAAGLEESNSITLETAHETILPQSWVAIIRPADDDKPHSRGLLVHRAAQVDVASRSDYGVTGKVTRIALRPEKQSAITTEGTKLKPLGFTKGWLEPEMKGDAAARKFHTIRDTVVFAQSERLELADLPITEPVMGATIELDRLHDGLTPGRWIIVEGERADLLQNAKELSKNNAEDETGQPLDIRPSGVRTAELVRVAAVDPLAIHGQQDTSHSHLTVTPALTHAYKRDTVIIHGNVIRATHGEIRKEVMGSGDASKPYQTFALRQGPITFVPAATPSGAASTLELRVNEIQWHEVDSLIDARPDDRAFVAERDGKGGARVVFGDGTRGARAPTGVENVKAQYRVGIGAAGNTRAGNVNQLLDRPPGAKEVTNPLPAEGGGDPDTPDHARDIAPLSVKALDRLVSVSDYRDFAQLFAGIAKANAVAAWAGARPKIVVTVAAAGGLPIAGSELHRSLVAALRGLGDPSRAVEVVDFERHLLVLHAGVRLLPDYSFDAVQPMLRRALLDAFSFERRRLGDDLPLAHVVAVMHGVEGVHSVDVDLFTTISAKDVASEQKLTDAITALGLPTLPLDRLPAVRSAGALVYASPALPAALGFKDIT